MSDHYHDHPEMEVARQKLTEALMEYTKATDPEAHLFLGGTVVFETTKFDDEGHQTYYTGHVILDPSSLSHAVGLLDICRDRLKKYVNREDDD